MQDLELGLDCVREYIRRMGELNTKHAYMLYSKRALRPIPPYTPKKKINVFMGMTCCWLLFTGIYVIKQLSAMVRVRGFDIASLEMKEELLSCMEVSMYILLIVCIPVGILIHIANREKEYKNKEAEMLQAAIRKENAENVELNKNNNQQIQVAILEKKEVYRNYKLKCADWFPQEYCYMEAVDFFLQHVTTHKTDTMEEIVRLYKEYLRREQAYPVNSTKPLTEQEELVKRQLQGRDLEQIVIDKKYTSYYNEKLFRDGIESLNVSLDSIWKSGYVM